MTRTQRTRRRWSTSRRCATAYCGPWRGIDSLCLERAIDSPLRRSLALAIEDGRAFFAERGQAFGEVRVARGDRLIGGFELQHAIERQLVRLVHPALDKRRDVVGPAR